MRPPSPDRIECIVPACRRSMGYDRWRKLHGEPPGAWAEWICPTHWKLVPQLMRRAYGRIRRRERKFGIDLPAGGRLWRRVKREAGALPPMEWEAAARKARKARNA